MTERTEIILCPLCGEVIHRHYAAPIFGRATLSSRVDPAIASMALTQMMLDADALHQSIVQAAEEACAGHMRTRHSRRFRLWQRFRWNWLLTRRWPWRAPRYEQFEFPV